MNKIKCLVCGEELESKALHDLVKCSCANKAYADGGDATQIVSAVDMTKILIWNEESKRYRAPVL